MRPLLLRFCALLILITVFPISASPQTQPNRAPIPKTLTLIRATLPIWAEASVAVTKSGEPNPAVWGSDTARIREILETPSDQPIYRNGKLVGYLNDGSSGENCRPVGPTYFDYPNPPRRGTLAEAVADSQVALLGLVTGRAYGFYAGVPGQLFQIKPIRSYGYPLSKDRYYFFMPVGRFRVADTEICKTDERYAEPPAIGGEVFLFVGKPTDNDGVLFHVLNPGDIVTVGPDGSLRLPRQYSAGEQKHADREPAMRTKSDLLERIQAVKAREAQP